LTYASRYASALRWRRAVKLSTTRNRLCVSDVGVRRSVQVDSRFRGSNPLAKVDNHSVRLISGPPGVRLTPLAAICGTFNRNNLAE